jgi:hypothetical protein
MRRVGHVLMGVGGIVGIAAAVWVAIGPDRGGLPWLVSVGLVKLTVLASFGLMAAGATLLRISRPAGKASPQGEIADGHELDVPDARDQESIRRRRDF